MRRPPLFRALSASLALGFALGLVESAALHACPMHDGGVARAAAASPSASAAHRGAHAPHGPAADHRATDDPSSEHERPHACTCLGECGVAVAVAAPEIRIRAVPIVVAEGRPPVLRSRVGARAASSHLLPPATAPPARVG
jgi:hypothetical protein